MRQLIRPILVMAVSAACGQQHSGDTYNDAATTDPPMPSAGALASATVIDRTFGSVTVAIPPTSSGDKLVIILKGTGSPPLSGSPPMETIIAGTTPLALALGGMTPEACGGWAWAWLSVGLPEGVNSVVIKLPPQSSVAGYVLAFAGLSPTVHLHEAWDYGFSRGSTSAPVGPSLEAGIRNVLVSAAGTCGSVGGLAPTSRFIALPNVDGSDVAYYIPPDPGAYGAEWSDTGVDWVVASLVLR